MHRVMRYIEDSPLDRHMITQFLVIPEDQPVFYNKNYKAIKGIVKKRKYMKLSSAQGARRRRPYPSFDDLRVEHTAMPRMSAPPASSRADGTSPRTSAAESMP
ncbi:hypothetical protein SDC9_187292 [bioreactor metagenome]|uniref:Uncharacterized protein n=1 Tax=bioreactor metagenome TaxID=1076179 RepID=A0A645HWP9_9ZZZZ